MTRGARRRRLSVGETVGGHKQIEHTADVAFELWGASFSELLVEGARAVIEVLVDGELASGSDRREVELAAIDDEDRLVRWLNEVLYFAIAEGFLVTDAQLRITATGVGGEVQGHADARDRVVTEVKSATYHDLVVREEGDRWVARVVMDV